jgi:phosphatidylserine synthase
MSRLVDAFISLPTWQGITLIVAFVAIVAIACLFVGRIAYRRGRRDAADHQLHWAHKQRELEAITG